MFAEYSVVFSSNLYVFNKLSYYKCGKHMTGGAMQTRSGGLHCHTGNVNCSNHHSLITGKFITRKFIKSDKKMLTF